MGVKVPTRCLDWCRPSVSLSPLSISSSSPSKRRTFYKYVHGSELIRFKCQKLYKTRSSEQPRARGRRIKINCTSGFDSLDDESLRIIHDMAMKFEFSDDFFSKKFSPSNGIGGRIGQQRLKTRKDESCNSNSRYGNTKFESFELPDWSEREEINLACLERKVNSLQIPISLRMIQKKKQLRDGVINGIKGSACSSMKKAFSSMVYIIQELHSCTLQMREFLLYEDLQCVLRKAHKDMQASFVWLFQQVFSHSPTLMVSVMILLANYSVYSMTNNTTIAYTMLPQAYHATTESVSVINYQSNVNEKFDISKITPFPAPSSGGKTTTTGGGGGKFRPVASSTDGEGNFDRVSSYSIIPDKASTSNEEASVSSESTKEEMRLWKSIVEEAAKMQAVLIGDALDLETMEIFISPVHVNIEVDDYEDYNKTELLYQMGLAQEPNNPLLLANYAQFLSRVIHDYDRAEYYFKRAVTIEPKDAEALDKYASFLWLVKKDTWAAEVTYLEAMNTDPSNSYYAANYANFLWNTGGEGTCFTA